jgi:hypothetical protein
MKHLKKYSELEEINEVSRELAKRAAQKAADNYEVSTNNSFDRFYHHKLINQYSLFKNYKEDQDFFEKIKIKIEKLGFFLEKEIDNKRKKIFYYLLNDKNKRYIMLHEDGKYQLCGHFKLSWITEPEQRKLHTCIKLLQQYLKQELLNPDLKEFLNKKIDDKLYNEIEDRFLPYYIVDFFKDIGITTIGDLIQCNYEDIETMEGFNKYEFNGDWYKIIDNVLKPYKLYLNMDLDKLKISIPKIEFDESIK